MRLGTSGLGVIAVVSLLVTAAPESIDGGGNNRESKIEDSRISIERIGISKTLYSWPVRVINVTGRIDNSRDSNFVKIEDDRRGSLLRSESSTFPLSSTSQFTAVLDNDRNTKTVTEVSRFPIDLFVSSRASGLELNSKRPANSWNDWSDGNSIGSSERKSKYSLKSDSSVTVISSPRDFDEKFVVNLDSPIVNFIAGASMSRSSIRPGSRFLLRRRRRRRCRRRRRGERETITRDEGTKTRDGHDDKGSALNENDVTKTRTGRSSTAESAITMSHRLTTMTSATNKTVISKRGFVDVNFRKATEPREFVTTRISPESSSNKGNTTDGESHFNNVTDEPIFGSTEATISLDSKNLLDTNNSHSTNHPVSQQPKLHFSILNDSQLGEDTNDRDDRGIEAYIDDSRMHKLTNNFSSVNSSSVSRSNGLRQDSLIRDLTTVRNGVSIPGTLIEVTISKDENLSDSSSVTEEIARTRQITREPLPDVLISGTGHLRLGENIGNTSGVDIRIASLNNHKAIRARSFQTTSAEHEKQEDTESESSSHSSRLPVQFGIKDAPFRNDETSILDPKTDKSLHAINQITFVKSVYPIARNNTKQSINLLDGKSNKIFYEIKPSLITDMDRDDDADYTTTTRRSFEKFLLPSVASAYGKFGPYFLDEEDRRNVTERIGNTVQLDCRIGLLGHRKVTWLQHYKDSFRLLTVERESYSVDQRISLNFQYPDNWRLQISYASMRDSGLYKCQVEIDQNRSLVKRYNVIITAPILMITDDSGRPISGERHLKAGSALKLRCEARDVIQKLNESVLWMRGDETLTDDVSENRTTEIVNERELTVVISNLLIERAIPRHAGNYSCVVSDKARTTIAVHVLNGELPAAVQHGSGVSTSVLNVWLIHLTASYGFLR